MRAITGMASSLGMIRVAEFVENEAIVEVLRELGVDQGQGFHLARPGPDFLSIGDIGTGSGS